MARGLNRPFKKKVRDKGDFITPYLIYTIRLFLWSIVLRGCVIGECSQEKQFINVNTWYVQVVYVIGHKHYVKASALIDKINIQLQHKQLVVHYLFMLLHWIIVLSKYTFIHNYNYNSEDGSGNTIRTEQSVTTYI